MKTLKKTLSLVLVMVMVLGLFGLASASSFKDDSTIDYSEAVDVLVALGVISGYEDGNFWPNREVTRAEAAKMVTYAVLGPTAAAELKGTTSSFTDVPSPAYDWAIPSIEYLVRVGVINGYGNGKFGPADKVTNYQIAKMLLCAIGYGANGEYVGNGWDLQVAVDAVKYGIFDGVYSSAASLDTATTLASINATRQQCAQFCFNALTGTVTVSWSPGIGRYVADPLTLNDGLGDYFVPSSTVGVTLGRAVYGLGITDQNDAFGRPGRVWCAVKLFGLRPIAFAYTSSPILTYTTAVNGTALKTAVLNKGYGWAGGVEIYRNQEDPSTSMTKAQIDALTAATVFGGNGTVIEVYGDAFTGRVTRIVVVVNYVGFVTAIGQDNPATTLIDERTITVAMNNDEPVDYVTVESDAPGFDAAYTAASAALAARMSLPVLVTPNGDDTDATYALTVAAAETGTLTPTSYVAGTSFVAGGKTYYFSDTFQGYPVNTFAPYDVIYDAYGYVIAAMPVNMSNLAVVLDKGTFTQGLASVNGVTLLMPDGTTKTVATSSDGVDNAVTSAVVGDIVIATPYSSTLYNVTKAASTQDALSAKAISVRSGVSALTWDNVSYYANANTLYFVRSGAPGNYTYNVYKGYANVPNLSGSASGRIYYDASNVAIALYVTDPVINSTVSNELVFVSGAAAARQEVTTPAGTYYPTNVVVNGVAKTLNLAGAYPAGIYTAMSTNNDTGIVTLANTGVVAKSDNTLYYANSVVWVDNASFHPSASCAVYFYNSVTGAITAGYLTQLPADDTTGANSSFFYLLNSTQTEIVAVLVDVTP